MTNASEMPKCRRCGTAGAMSQGLPAGVHVNDDGTVTVWVDPCEASDGFDVTCECTQMNLVEFVRAYPDAEVPSDAASWWHPSPDFEDEDAAVEWFADVLSRSARLDVDRTFPIDEIPPAGA